MTNSDDSTGFGGGNPGAPSEDHARMHDPRYGKPGTANTTDPRNAQPSYYPGPAPTTAANYPSGYPGAGGSGAPLGDTTHSGAYPTTSSPAAPADRYGAPSAAEYRTDNAANYRTSAEYSAAADNSGGHYAGGSRAGGQPEPPNYPEYRQPTPHSPRPSEYSPAADYGTAALRNTGEQHAPTFETGTERSVAYDRRPADSYSGVHGSHRSYTTDQPAAADNYRYGAAMSESASAVGNSRGQFDTAYEEPGRRDSYGRRDYESPFDTYASAPAGNYEQSGYQEPGYGDVYFEGDNQGDADFYDGDYGEDYPVDPPRSKRTLLVAGALCGALVVGGGLAYAYKSDFLGLGFGGQFAGDPPLIQADKEPSKIKPVATSSKLAENGGKLIYDRLQDPAEADKADTPEERVVARQESVLDTSSIAAQLDDEKPATMSGKSSSMSAAAMKKEMAGPSSESPTQPAGQASKLGGLAGPRKVKTYQVKPDGTVMKPAAPAETAEPQPVPANINTASISRPAEAAIAALPKPAPKRTAALATPTPAPPADVAAPVSAQFAVQIAARRTQTDALATFANLQQRFPNLLTPYQPLIQKADLGSKGTWYRLRIGPMGDKPSASDLCTKLKTAGLKGCLVRPL